MQATTANNIETMRTLLMQAESERKRQTRRRLLAAILLCTGGMLLSLGGGLLLRQTSLSDESVAAEAEQGERATGIQNTAMESRLENTTTAYVACQDKE